MDIEPINGNGLFKYSTKIQSQIQKTRGITYLKKNITNKKTTILALSNNNGMSDNSRNKMESFSHNKNNSELISFNDNTSNNNFNYNNFKLNSLTYENALRLDKRTFTEYYSALLAYNNLLFFSFIPNGDYNPRLLKMFLYFFFFSLNIVFNALFFTDETIEMIYDDKGTFNFVYQIPKILYSTILSVFIFYLMRYFFLTENNIEELKGEIKKNN